MYLDLDYPRGFDRPFGCTVALAALPGRNGGNQVIFYGKGGDIATNRRDEQELSVACLRVLQAAVAYVNTLLVQDVLTEPAWADALTLRTGVA
jgi:TnpA family transposase